MDADEGMAAVKTAGVCKANDCPGKARSMSRCKGCGAQIIFIETPNGKSMPVDPSIIPYWKDPKGDTMIVNENGNVVRCFLDGEPDEITDVGFRPHWATCPAAKQFRRKH